MREDIYHIRDRSLITGRGGGYNTGGGGGQVKFHPYEKGSRVVQVLAMLKEEGGG